MAKTTRMTLDMGENFDKLLTRVATEKSLSKAEIIRRAVASYAYLNEETKTSGRRVSITTDGEKVVKDIVLP